jgi:hypothetical protein
VNPIVSMLQIYYDNPNDGRRLRAWEAHYEAKGCGKWKAVAVAWKRCQRNSGWPPEQR